MAQTDLPDAPHYHAYSLRFWTEPVVEPQVRLRMVLINLRKIRGLFESSIKEARRGFRIASVMDPLGNPSPQ